MKPVVAGILLAVSVLSAPSQAQAIYKCVVGGAITYQQSPCEVQAPAKAVESNTALIGQWRYDSDTTMAWMKHHDTLTKTQEAELSGLGGHETLTVTRGLAVVEVTDYDVAHVSGAVHKQGRRQEIPYTVRTANPLLVSIAAQNPDTLAVYTTDFHFEGHDTIWISLANQRLTAVDDPNARMYFKRVR